jgi:MYXO-CTERM domain-containing protein
MAQPSTEESTGTPWWTLGVLAIAAIAALILWRRR